MSALIPALAFTDIGKVHVLEVETPQAGPGEVVLNVSFSSVSPGTELRCLAGKQVRAPKFPFIPGYALAGTVSSVGEGVTKYKVGDRVIGGGTRRSSIDVLWGGHVSQAVLPASSLIRVPDGLGLREASISKLVAIPLRGVRFTSPQPGEKVAVVGLGPIGLLSARLFAAHGAEVIGFDAAASRIHFASEGGLATQLVDGVLSEVVKSRFGGGADIVVDATGSPAVLAQSVLSARLKDWNLPGAKGSRLVIQGSYPEGFTLDYDDVFSREMTILVPRDCERIDQEDAVTLIAEGKCRVDDMHTLVSSPADAQAVYDSLIHDRTQMTAAFAWS